MKWMKTIVSAGVIIGLGASWVLADVYIWASPQTITADGHSQATVSAWVSEQVVLPGGTNVVQGVANVPVYFGVTGPATLVGANPVLTDASGDAVITLVAGSVAGEALVSADTEGYGGNVTAVTLTPGVVPNLPPTVTASATPTAGKKPLNVQFSAAAADRDGTVVSYAWAFGDGQTSSLPAPAYRYRTVGEYRATVTVTDDDGAKASSTVVITVKK